MVIDLFSVVTNVLDDATCTKRATAGDCNSTNSATAAYMGAYCKKACLMCNQTTGELNLFS